MLTIYRQDSKRKQRALQVARYAFGVEYHPYRAFDHKRRKLFSRFRSYYHYYRTDLRAVSSSTDKIFRVAIKKQVPLEDWFVLELLLQALRLYRFFNGDKDVVKRLENEIAFWLPEPFRWRVRVEIDFERVFVRRVLPNFVHWCYQVLDLWKKNVFKIDLLVSEAYYSKFKNELFILPYHELIDWQSLKVKKDIRRDEDTGAFEVRKKSRILDVLYNKEYRVPTETLLIEAMIKPESRYCNVYFQQKDQVLADKQPLIAHNDYLFTVTISPEQFGISGDGRIFPEETLESFFKQRLTLPITVSLYSSDIEIHNPARQTLNLPKMGTSSPVDFNCFVPSDCINREVRLHLDCHFRGFLLQSKDILVWVLESQDACLPDGVLTAQRVEQRFEAVGALSQKMLLELPERPISITTQHHKDGSFSLRALNTVTSSDMKKNDFRAITSESFNHQISYMREALQELASDQQYREYLHKKDNKAFFLQKLPDIARLGSNLCRMLLPGYLQDDLSHTLHRSKETATIQVNPLLEHAPATVPWNLVYMRPFQYILGGSEQSCDLFDAEECPLAYDLSGDEENCPHKDNFQVACPYAFLGFRYVIEQVPSWVGLNRAAVPPLVTQIRNQKKGEQVLCDMNMNYNNRFAYVEKHICEIEGLLSIKKAADVGKAFNYMSNYHEWDLIYFFCHGGIEQGAHYLELTNGKLYESTLAAIPKQAPHHWPHHPLIILNACKTAEYQPHHYFSLIETFRGLGACGVIAVDAPVPEVFGYAFAKKVLTQFFDGQGMGKTLLDMRRHFLLECKNPLGLLYSLFAVSEICLTHSIKKES
ncbi:hypothetical protein ACQZV8_09455 [Magnetococcales bacterium HHB-1]